MLGLGASPTKPFVEAPLIQSPTPSSDWSTVALANRDSGTCRFSSPLPSRSAARSFVDSTTTTIRSRLPSSSSNPRLRLRRQPRRASPPQRLHLQLHQLHLLQSRQLQLRALASVRSSRHAQHNNAPRPAPAPAPAPAPDPAPRGRLGGGRADTVFPTDPQSSPALPPSPDPASLDAPDNPQLNTLSQQPKYPGASTPSPDVTTAAAAALHHHRHHSSSRRLGPQDSSFLHSPFRSRTDASSRRRRLSAARLWNPTNSTPRIHPSRKRRPSTPPPPSIPLNHPALDSTKDTTDPVGTRAGNYPLLTLPEQRQTKHSASTRASLQIERRASTDKRVSLPRSVRASYDEKRPQTHSPSIAETEAGPSTRPIQEGEFYEAPRKLDKGKGKAIMIPQNDDQRRSYSKDLERGPDIMDPRISNVSAGDGIGSAISSSNSSIMGEDVQPDAAGEWGPQHPCYPHLNPHVPIDSAEYVTTRIIRIRRDWLVEGDLAPTFSNLYPEILDPAGFSEQEFRRVIEKLNGELVPAFNPYGFRNMLDSMLGLVTGWVWDDVGLTGIKSRLNNLETWIQKWNLEMEKTMGSEDGATPPKLVSLRRTGYMTLDIQIPDPEIAPAPSTNAGDSRTALPLEPAPALTMLS
ncbi:Fc.00g109850.m01.CDS01 [Cosmosporella sp. VM-42]